MFLNVTFKFSKQLAIFSSLQEMSTNAFQLNEEARATFKAPVPIPEQEPLDEFDQFDEMFLQLNNALIGKHDALIEKAEELEKKEEALDRREAALIINEEELKKKEADVKKKEAALNETKENLLGWQQENEDKEAELTEKEKELEKKEEQSRRDTRLNIKEAELKQKELRLNKKEEELKKKEAPEIPRILFLIPPKEQNNQSLPFAKLLGGTAFNSIYIQIGLLFKTIDTAMRMVYKSTHNKNTQLTIASVYYLTMFPSATLNDVYETSFFIYNTLYAIGDSDLQAALKPFLEKVVMKLKEAIP